MHSRMFLAGALLVAMLCTWGIAPTRAQGNGPNWYQLVGTPAVSGYEQELASEIRGQLKDFSSNTDNLGNVIVTIGSGEPHRLIVTPMDEPGYVVSAITPDGYLRLQRLPQAAPNAVFDLLYAAQPITVLTRKGEKVAGVVAGLSVHLQPARLNPPKMSHPDEMYVDIVASSAAEVREAGVDLLDPISLNHDALELANGQYTAPAIGDHFGCVALVDLLNGLRAGKTNFSGTLTVAFITQQWTGGRGLDRILNEISADEIIYVGRLSPPRKAAGAAPATEPIPTVFKPGDGVLLGVPDEAAPLSGLSADLAKSAELQHITLRPELAAPPRIGGYATPTPLPKQFAQLGVEILNSATPAEMLSTEDVNALTGVLYSYISGSAPQGGIGGVAGSVSRGLPDLSLLQTLTETYGASGHEIAVREAVRKWLPKEAKT